MLSSKDVVARHWTRKRLLLWIGRLADETHQPRADLVLGSLIWESREDVVPEDLRVVAAEKAKLAAESRANGWNAELAEIFIVWGRRIPLHKQTCVGFLKHSSCSVRRVALENWNRFLEVGEIEILFRFRDDLSICEYGMGGSLYFDLRNMALDLVCAATGFPIVTDHCETELDGERVSYKSWSAFLNWFEQR